MSTARARGSDADGIGRHLSAAAHASNTGSTADRIITALLPPRARPCRSHERLPLVNLATHIVDGSTVYAVARVDASGTLAAKHVVDALAWPAGARIEISVIHATIAVRHIQPGTLRIPRRRSLTIPAGVRRACQIEPGDCVLVAGLLDYNLILIHSISAVDRMLTLYHAEANSRAA